MDNLWMTGWWLVSHLIISYHILSFHIWWLSPTPLKNMSSSIGMIITNMWENTYHILLYLIIHTYSHLSNPLRFWQTSTAQNHGCDTLRANPLARALSFQRANLLIQDSDYMWLLWHMSLSHARSCQPNGPQHWNCWKLQIAWATIQHGTKLWAREKTRNSQGAFAQAGPYQVFCSLCTQGNDSNAQALEIVTLQLRTSMSHVAWNMHEKNHQLPTSVRQHIYMGWRDPSNPCRWQSSR